jgi:hypothetical protein
MTKLLQFSFYNRRPGDKSRPTVFWGDDYEKLIKAFPEFVVPASVHKVSHFGINLPEGHPKLAEVFEFVKRQFGLTPILSYTQQKQIPANDLRHFRVDTHYDFDEQDIENATFLRMSTLVEMGIDGRGGQEGWDRWGLVQAANKLPIIGYLDGWGWQICTAATRVELEQESFSGLDFLPVIVHDPRYQQGDFWRIWANRSMPKVSMPLCDVDGKPVKEDYSTGCSSDEIIGFPYQTILKYKTADLAAMSGTDFALTAEKWGTPKDRDRREILVVSQRFRQWCLKQKVEAKWTPVIALPE